MFPIIAALDEAQTGQSMVSGFINTITGSTLNIFLTSVCVVLVYLYFRSSTSHKGSSSNESIKLPEPLPKQDLTLEELRQYDGHGPDGRVCLAINGEIYDCTKGKRFYGPEGPYAPLAGHDATRSLATFDVEAVKDEWDDHSDLTVSQMSSVQEWQEQFAEKYNYVGKLVRTEAEKSLPDISMQSDDGDEATDSNENDKSQ